MGAPPVIIPASPKMAATTEIVRSFTYKLNVGNYESRDFFCSQRAECALEDADRVSEILYDFCRTQVLKSVKDYLRDKEEQQRKASAVQERKRA